MKADRYLEEADQEFQEHIGYFVGVSRTVATRFVDDVEAAVNEIRRHPGIGTRVTRQVRKRVLTGFKYNILYVLTLQMKSSSWRSHRTGGALATGANGSDN